MNLHPLNINKKLNRFVRAKLSLYKTYGTKVEVFDMGQFGKIKYAQWLHPDEGIKSFNEAQVIRLRKFIKKGDTVIDIGAHTGDTTIPLSLATGKKGLVLAFEPNPVVFSVLKRNSLLNEKIVNIKPINAAITTSPGKFTFQYSDPGLCNGGNADSIMKGSGKPWNVFKIKVTGERLQSFLKKFPGNVSFIKIDTEGYDKEIISSIKDIILKYQPTIQTEVYPGLTRNQREELFQTINNLGYLCYTEDMEGPLTKEEILDFKELDILCLSSKLYKRVN